MTTKERYNRIIDTIETLVKGEKINGGVVYLSDHDISDRAFNVAESAIMNDNGKNVMFIFLNNCTVIDYISERRMVAAYKMICFSDEWNKQLIDSAIELTRLSDYQAFCKKFKRYFGISPKKAFITKESAIIPAVRDWDSLAVDGKSKFVKFEENEMADKKFGISRESFVEAYAAANLQSFYKLNDFESEIAFNLAKDKNLSFDSTFEYIYNYVWSYVDEESGERDERLEQDLLRPEVIHMYFSCGMSFNEIFVSLLAMNRCKLPRKIEDTNRLYLLGFYKYSKWVDEFKNIVSVLHEVNMHDVYKENALKRSYEDIYKYYIENAPEKNDDKIYVKYVENCAYDDFCRALMGAYDYVEIDNSYDIFEDCDDFEDLKGIFEYTIDDFNLLCDELDKLDEQKELVKEEKASRKLIGYKSLDIEQINELN